MSSWGARSATFNGGRGWQLTWMKPVATITPEPKYFEKKKAHDGMHRLLLLFAMMGNRAPKLDVHSITKMADTRRPMAPSYSLPLAQAGAAAAASSALRSRKAKVSIDMAVGEWWKILRS